jgi:hypothetical protein
MQATIIRTTRLLTRWNRYGVSEIHTDKTVASDAQPTGILANIARTGITWERRMLIRLSASRNMHPVAYAAQAGIPPRIKNVKNPTTISSVEIAAQATPKASKVPTKTSPTT